MVTLSLPLRQLLILVRAILSLGVSFSALAVYMYYRHSVDAGALCVFAGVFLLSCAASSLNQYQERAIDARMERTKNRPLPLQLFSTSQIVTVSMVTGLCGSALLFFGANPEAAFFGACAVFVYSAVYTPCKTRTPFALIPGAIAGAIPVLIGCAAAVGRIDEKAIYMASFAFFWQIPHFLLLSLRFADDYRGAGIPTLLLFMPPERVKSVACVWVLAASAVTTLFPIMGILRSIPLMVALVIMNVIVAVVIIRTLPGKDDVVPEWILYAYQGMVLVILMAQGVVGKEQGL